MTNSIETWITEATRCLSADSRAQVRTEIQEHYESAREEALTGGAPPEEVDQVAIAALGNPNAANREYRKVLLTSAEASMLRDAKWEARAVCSRPWLKSLLLIPTAVLCSGVWYSSSAKLTLIFLVALAGVGLLYALFLPIYTPARGRIFRGARWAWLAAVLVVASWPDFLQLSWLLPTCAAPMVWLESTLFSLRRKLPVGKWPKQLYL